LLNRKFVDETILLAQTHDNALLVSDMVGYFTVMFENVTHLLHSTIENCATDLT